MRIRRSLLTSARIPPPLAHTRARAHAQTAYLELEKARAEVAAYVGADVQDLVFVSNVSSGSSPPLPEQ